MRERTVFVSVIATLVPLAILVSLTALSPIMSACHFDRDYRMRTWERCRLQGQEYFLKGEFEHAEKAYKQTIKQAEFIGRSSYYYGISLMCLGELYRAMHKYDLARVELKKALAVLTKCGSSSAIDKKLLLQNIARTQAWIADTYLFARDYKQAQLFYRDAISTADAWRIKGTYAYQDHLLGQTVALSVYKLAIIFDKTGKQTESQRSYDESLYIADASALPLKLKDRIIEDYRDSLISSGQKERADNLEIDKNCQEYMDQLEVYANERDWPKAEAAAKKAILEAERFDSNDSRIVTVLRELIRIYTGSKRYDEAEAACLRRLKICQFHKANQEEKDATAPKKEPPVTPLGVQELPFGGTYDSHAKIIENNDLRIAECHANLADIYGRTGMKTKAHTEALQAYELLIRLGSEQRYAMTAVQQLCDAFFREEDWKKALSLTERSLQYCSTGTGGLGCTYCLNLWRIYCADRALHPEQRFDEIRREAEAGMLALSVEEQYTAGVALNNIAAICVSKKQWQTAETLYKVVMRLGGGYAPYAEVRETARNGYAGILQSEGRK